LEQKSKSSGNLVKMFSSYAPGSRSPIGLWPPASQKKKKEKLMPGNPGIFLIL